MQLAEVTILFYGYARQDTGQHLCCLTGTQDRAGQERVDVTQFTADAQPICQCVCLLDTPRRQPGATGDTGNDPSQGMFGLAVTNQDQSHPHPPSCYSGTWYTTPQSIVIPPSRSARLPMDSMFEMSWKREAPENEEARAKSSQPNRHGSFNIPLA